MNASRNLFCKRTHAAFWGGLGIALLLGQQAATLCHAADTVVAWGDNNSSQCDVPTGLTNVIAVAGGDSHSLALKKDGTVAAWGFNLAGQANVPPGLSNVSAIAAGSSFSVALKNDGTVTNWGSLMAPAGLSNVMAIAAGWTHCLALKSNGTVVAWGSQSTVPAGLGSVMAIAAGTNHNVALRLDGTIVAWGDNSYGQTNVPASATNVIAIAAGGGHSLALKRDGSIIGWGLNNKGQTNVPPGLNAVAISAGALHSLCLLADGTMRAWGDNSYGQTNVTTTVGGFVGIASGGYHNLAIKGDNRPVILHNPWSQNVFLTKSATLQVLAAGAQPLYYQWQHYGTNLNGATSASLLLQNFQPTDAGPYAALVANAYGSVTSAPAVLTPIGGPPVFLLAPQSQTTNCGDTAVFLTSVEGSGPFGYQWLHAGTNLPYATNSSLFLTNVVPSQGGQYALIVTNNFGSITGLAALTITSAPPLITSPLTAFAAQGQPFSYTITALHNPLSFNALDLPLGLSINPTNGLISGTNLEAGTFGVILVANNACTTDTELLELTVNSSAPVITSPLMVSGTEGIPINPYQITATQSPTWFDAQNLPVGLFVDHSTGLISGTPMYAGTFSATIFAGNQWKTNAATLQFSIVNATVAGLSIDRKTFTYHYHAPYLLDFMFTLRDNDNPNLGYGLVTDPNLIKATCMENWPVGSLLKVWPADSPDYPTGTNMMTNFVSETGIFMARGSGKVLKTYLVLDYSESISDPVLNGDSDNDGISDAVSNMVAGAQYYVDQQPAGAQLGAYEFHNDFEAPNNILDPTGAPPMGLTKDKALLDGAISGIWTNFIAKHGYGASRCWDAVDAAILALGDPNDDEQHVVIFVSDGWDDASTVGTGQIINDANAGHVQVYCIAFGQYPNTNTLSQITSNTKGRLYVAQSPADLYLQFSLASKDIQAQYVLRWASTRRAPSLNFAPMFTLSYQGHTNAPPDWTWRYDKIVFPNIDTTVDPPKTNSPITNVVVLWANTVIGPYNINGYTDYGAVTNGGFEGPFDENGGYVGDVTSGALRLVLDDEVEPSGITLRASYIPRYVRQLQFHYRANWPCSVSLDATNSGEMLSQWSMTETSDGAGGNWLLLSSPFPQYQSNSLPFAAFGPLVTFKFDLTNGFSASNAFSFIEPDNTIYTNVAGGQSFAFEDGNTNAFVQYYPALAHGTPIPWLQYYGLGTDDAAELQDSDGDGIPNWQEFLANTDPTDPASAFVIRSITKVSGGQWQIVFSTSSNRTYRLEASTDLVNWDIVQDGIPGINADVAITDTRFLPGVTSFYYRVLVY